MVTLMSLLKTAVDMPSALKPLTGAQAVTYTAPCLPTSMALKVIVVLAVALVAVMTLVVVAMKGTGLKAAVTFFAASIVTTHAPAPVQAPLQPAKVLPEAGAAVSVTLAPLAKLPLQVGPQLMPAGLLVTVPLPDLVTVMAGLPAPVLTRVNVPEESVTVSTPCAE
jgi:hypothetical protein